MIIKSFNIKEVKSQAGINSIIVYDVADLSPLGFDLKGTFESGQCFRWNLKEDEKYFGIVGEKAVNVSLLENRHLFIENSTAQDFDNIWHGYFDLGTDYKDIIDAVDKDSFMHKSIIHSAGARMLVQEFEETLFSYIISAQNNIPRIKKLVEQLCAMHGEKIFTKDKNGNDVFLGYSFPDKKTLASKFCNQNNSNCKPGNLCSSPFAGYRCPYIKKTASMLSSGEYIPDFEFLSESCADEARKDLCKLSGVGEKVADCTLLYSGIRKDICPIDVWVEKIIRSNYLGDKAKKVDIRNFTEKYFEKYAGYAQLWFFNYSRNIQKNL